MLRSTFRRVRTGFGAQSDPAYQALIEELIQQRSLYMLGYVGLAYPAFYALDVVVYPESWRAFGYLRALHAALGIGGLLGRHLLGHARVVFLARVAAVSATGTVAVMCALTNGFSSLYVAGMILCYLAISTVELYKPTQLIVVLIALSMFYFVLNASIHGVSVQSSIAGTSFLAGAVLFCAVSASLTEHSRRALFSAQQALLVKNAELERARHHQEQFLNTVSHELRSPVNSILGFIELVEGRDENNLHPKSLSNLSRIKQSGRRLLAMINDLLDLSKAESGQMELHRTTFDLMHVLHEVAEATRALVVHRDVEVFVHGPSELFVHSDEQRLRQIAINLASNAARFTEEGSITLSVSLAEGLLFEVADTGPGIAPEARETIFEAFRQLGVATGGTGLGLSIVRRLVQLLDGQVEVVGEVGEGSTFRVHLPNQTTRTAA